MNLNVRATGTWQHTLDIEIPAEEVDLSLDEVARRIQRRAVLPGFRRGKVPLARVRQDFAEVVEREFLDDYLSRATGQALQESKLDPVVPPLVRDLSLVPGKPMTFQVVVDVRPDVEVRDHKGIPITRPQRPVEDAAVDAMMERLRQDSAVFVDLARPAQRGDVAVADSVRLDANGRRIASTRARNLRLELGAPDMPPDLENGLLGSEAGQERTVDIEYPADYRTEDLAGKRVRYLVRVRKIQEKKLRALDDNFAREVFDLPSFEALRAQVRENLERDERERTRREVEEAITDELVRRNPLDLPERLVDWTLGRMIREATADRPVDDALRDEMRTRYRPAVERSLKREVLLASVARHEGIAVSDDDVSAEIERMVQADPKQAARVRARYQSGDRRHALAEGLLERKAMDWLIEAAVVDEAGAGRIVPATR